MGEVIDVYIRGLVGLEYGLYHLELKSDKEEAPILLSPAATFDFDVIGRDGDWTVCGEHIYWSGGVDNRTFKLIPHLFKHSITKDIALKKWQIQHHNNTRPMSFVDVFAAADVYNQKLYFMGGTYLQAQNDGKRTCFAPKKTLRPAQCFDLPTLRWSLLSRTMAKEIPKYKYNSRRFNHVAAKVRNGGDEPMEIVYYDLSAGSILFLDVTNGGSRRLHDADFAVLRLLEESDDDFECTDADEMIQTVESTPPVVIPRGLNCTDIDELIETVENTRAVVTNDTFYWLTFDLRLFAYDINAKTWLEPFNLSGRLPRSYSTPRGAFCIQRYPLLLGLPNRKMVVIIHTSPGELTAASLEVHKMDTCFLKVDVKDTQAYTIKNPNRYILLSEGEALLRNTW